MICRRRSSRKVTRQPSAGGATPGRQSNKKEALVYKCHFSLSKVLNVLRVKETSEVQRCISIAINHKEQRKFHKKISISKSYLSVSLFTHQITKEEDKESILTTLCDAIIKDRDGDREMMKDIITETEHGALNINLKVNRFAVSTFEVSTLINIEIDERAGFATGE